MARQMPNSVQLYQFDTEPLGPDGSNLQTNKI